MKNIIDIKIGKAFERISKKVTEWVKNIEMNKVYNRAGKVFLLYFIWKTNSMEDKQNIGSQSLN